MLILIVEVLLIDLSFCSVGNINYMDTFIRRQYQKVPIEDPCNPPYWYPRYIPEYCFEKATKRPMSNMPLPVPIPVPHPVGLPPIYPISNSFPISQPPPHIPPNIPVPFLRPVSIDEQLTPVMAAPGIPYQPFIPPYKQFGMVPGLPGIVSPDGGVNILPFSDAYSDLLEKHKRKILKKRMKKILRDYKRVLWRKHYD